VLLAFGLVKPLVDAADVTQHRAPPSRCRPGRNHDA
jgi:hypothetical protein